MNANTGRKVYCTRSPQHQPGEHDVSCLPSADPGNLELRLIRLLTGACPECDVTTEHEHPCRCAASSGTTRACRA